MALQGKLTIMGKTYGIIQAEFEFAQQTDESNKPASRPKGGNIKFVMPTTSDMDQMFYRWMFNKTEVKDGVFVFTVWTYDNRRAFKTVAFHNAYCVGLKDYFNNSDSKLMYTTITLAAEDIVVGTLDVAIYHNEWK